MCGIAGILGFSSQSYEFALDSMLKVQHHRGPDYTGKLIGENYAFGHNRLSIIDLNEASNQPMLSNCGRYILVFNGEIYNYNEIKKNLNYDFKSKGDSEVLLAAYIQYGVKCLDLLNGMFAFAIYDIKEKRLFAARDRFGVKPFYYSKTASGFVFSSEIKTMFSSGLVPNLTNEKTWSNYLKHGYYPSDNETFYLDVNQLESGCYLIYESEKLEVAKYYDFEKETNKYTWENKEVDEVKDIFKKQLKASIQYRLLADVKRGFNLSGGVDSTLLFSLIRDELDSKLTRAFSFYSNDERYDEIQWVREILHGTDFNLTPCLITSDEIPSLAEKIQFHQDEPYSGIATLAYAKTFEMARKEGYTVILDGSGMDEQIGGYDYYYNKSGSIVQGSTSNPFRENVLKDDFSKLSVKVDYPKPFNNELKNLQYRDLFYTKLPRDLRMTDRISMAYSIEMREPFLDHDLVEKSFSLPDEFKFRFNKTKWLMREILKEVINKNIAEAPKRPIQTPQREWLSNELKTWVYDTVMKGVENTNWLNKSLVEKELDLFFNHDNSNSFYIWQWISIGLIFNKK